MPENADLQFSFQSSELQINKIKLKEQIFLKMQKLTKTQMEEELRSDLSHQSTFHTSFKPDPFGYVVKKKNSIQKVMTQCQVERNHNHPPNPFSTTQKQHFPANRLGCHLQKSRGPTSQRQNILKPRSCFQQILQFFFDPSRYKEMGIK